MKKKKYFASLIVLILTVLLVFWFLNRPISNTDKQIYELEISNKSIDKLEVISLKTVNFTKVLDAFKNTIEKSLPFTHLSTFKKQKHIKSIISDDIQELDEFDKKIIESYKRYIKDEKVYSSIPLVQSVEISLYIASGGAIAILFYFFYLFIPKQISNVHNRFIYFGVVILFNIGTFLLFLLNNDIEKDIISTLKLVKKNNDITVMGLNRINKHKFDFVEFDSSNKWKVTHKEIEKDYFIQINCLNEDSDSILLILIINNKNDKIEWVNFIANKFEEILKDTEFKDLKNIQYLNYDSISLDFTFSKNKRYGQITSFYANNKTVLLVKQVGNKVDLKSNYSLIEKSIKFN